MRIIRLFAAVLGLVCAAAAQPVDTIPLRALLSGANEAPAGDAAISGVATVWLHVVRDAQGNVVSGSATSQVSYNFPGSVTLTAMHIHTGSAGENGAVVLPFQLDTTTSDTGKGILPTVQTQFPSTAVPLDIVNGILNDPSKFYYNVHTTVAPGGAMRGQLQRADMVVLMGLMSRANEVSPVVETSGSGVSSVVALITRDAAGTPTSGYVIFDLNYTGFPDGTNFTGFHIHSGAAGVNGPVTISSGLSGPVPADAGGAGNLHYEVEADVTKQSVVDTLYGLLWNPDAFYINAHTAVSPGGVMRSQLLRTDKMVYQLTLNPANENPPVSITASAPAAVTLRTVRNADGSVAAGVVIFDVNPRFPSGTTFTGMHIHDGAAGTNGPVTIDSQLTSSPILVADGTGNIYRIATVSTDTALNTLRSLTMTPQNQYLNVHTPAKPGGAARAQVGSAPSAPAVTFVETSVYDHALTTIAPGSLFSIFGSGLAPATVDSSGLMGNTGLASSLNGVTVTVGGKTAPLVFVSPTQINAQVPFEVAPGPQTVVVTTAAGSSTAYNATVAATAPAIFFDTVGGSIIKNSDFSLVRPDNPASGGDVLIVYLTGLGQTSPELETGKFPTSTVLSNATVPIEVAVGGVNASVLYSAASPGYAGLYQIAFQVPAGFPAGNVPLLVTAGGVPSNVVSLAVQ